MSLAAAVFALALQSTPIELFNGKDLTGWVPMNKAEWAVENGCLTLKSGNGWLRTEGKYKDFELSVDWKTEATEAYDSGILFHALEKGEPWPRVCTQVNLLKGKEGEGVGLKEAAVPAGLFKPGDWNSFVIRVQGRSVKLMLNGKEAWSTELIAPREGYIGLQGENVRFQFRNLKVTPLKAD
jgi:hypothetical protein